MRAFNKAVAALCLCAAITGCASGTAQTSGLSNSTPTLPGCPGAGGDQGGISPTVVSPINPALRGKMPVLARATPAHSTVVRAVVTDLERPTEPPRIKTLVRSQVLITRQVWETVRKAHGAPPPAASGLRAPHNVVAASVVVRTTDLLNHRLRVTVPAGLTPRDYFVVATQQFSEVCRRGGAGETDSVIGLVRIRR